MPQVRDQQQSQVTSDNVVTLGNVVTSLSPGVTSGSFPALATGPVSPAIRTLQHAASSEPRPCVQR